MATTVEMTGMPELIALLHSFVGLAAVLVGWNGYLHVEAHPRGLEARVLDAAGLLGVHSAEVFIGVFIGAVTFTGSIVANLKRRCVAEGVDIVHGRVRTVDLGPEGGLHTVSVQQGDVTSETTARWVVDASGRNRVLPRQLELRRTNEHHCNAAWFRVATEIDVGAWSDDPRWHSRLAEGERAMSTNHLMGEGYWVWLIRLASGATSVGIVADPAFHAFDEFNTLEKARAWLAGLPIEDAA